MTAHRPKCRIRASQAAMEKAIAAIQNSGLTVDKLLIEGGRIEIRIAGVEQHGKPENDDGLQPWD